MDVKEILTKYWEEIVALIDKIYAAIKDAILANEEDAE